MGKNIHTVYNKSEQQWENKVEGQKTPASTHRTKDAAVDQGRRMAKSGEKEHLIHGKDGLIQERNSYGGDPYPPKG